MSLSALTYRELGSGKSKKAECQKKIKHGRFWDSVEPITVRTYSSVRQSTCRRIKKKKMVQSKRNSVMSDKTNLDHLDNASDTIRKGSFPEHTPNENRAAEGAKRRETKQEKMSKKTFSEGDRNKEGLL